MTTSMYFSTEQIQVVQGKFQKNSIMIQNAFVEALPQGALINGVITDESAVITSLENLIGRSNLKKEPIDLIVDSGSVLIKRLEVPILPGKKLLDVTKGEFAGVKENYDELIYDYGVIASGNDGDSGAAILCSAMESTFAFSYIEIFKKLKLKLKSIDIAISAEIGLAQFFQELKGQTFILCVLESNNIVSSLFVNGQYCFTNRMRLLSDRGTPESVTEISQTISSLMQFNQSQKTGAEVSRVYFCGLKPEEIVLTQELSNIYNLAVVPLPDFPQVIAGSSLQYRLADHFYVTGNLLIKDGSYHG